MDCRLYVLFDGSPEIISRRYFVKNEYVIYKKSVCV